MAVVEELIRIENNETLSFGNYTVFKDPVFAIVIKNTLKFSLIVIPLGMVMGFLLAVLVSKNGMPPRRYPSIRP